MRKAVWTYVDEMIASMKADGYVMEDVPKADINALKGGKARVKINILLSIDPKVLAKEEASRDD